MNSTVYALATPAGRSAIAIVRLSGPGVAAVLSALGADDLRPRQAHLRRLRLPDGGAFDEALALWFPAPASFTGEDCGELHLHGGRAVIEGCVAALAAQGCEPASPGEFARRAFENGRLDLTQAEGIADLIEAETSAQRAQALGQLGGELSARYAGFRQELLEALALLEAEIDFPDEDTPHSVAVSVDAILQNLEAGLAEALGDAERGQRVRDGYRIALIGDTNAGKSTLFNALVGREAAIVTPTPGTTRDVLEARLTVGGYAVTLVDTAGLRDTNDPVEMEGVRRARLQAEEADLRLWVRAVDALGDDASQFMRSGDLALLNKIDLATPPAPDGLDALSVTSRVEGGLDELHRWIADHLHRTLYGSDFPSVTRERHRMRLRAALERVRSSRPALLIGPELAAGDLRAAAQSLAEVAGEVGVEDILSEVFATFCIGK